MLPCPPPVVERLTYVAKSKSLDVGDLLGVIMAHEIGHLLLPAGFARHRDHGSEG